MSSIINKRITFPLRNTEIHGHSSKCKTRKGALCDCWKGPDKGIRPKKLTADEEGDSKAYGWLLNRKEIVVDIDPRDDGETSFKKFLEDFPDFPWNTYCVHTGHDTGRHYYLSLPYSTSIKIHLKDYPGIEFKSYGNYVTKPGSIRGDNGREYTVVNNGAIQECPMDLLSKLEIKKLPVTISLSSEEEPLWVLEMALSYLNPRDYRNYHDWLLIGRSLFSGCKGKADGLNLWYEWSKQDELYGDIDINELKEKWVSFYNTEEVTAKTLLHFSAKEGFDLNAILAKEFKPVQIEGEIFQDKTTFHDWIYITNIGKFINRYYGDFLSYTELTVELSYLLGKNSIKTIMNGGMIERAYKIGYYPEKKSFITDSTTNYLIFNLWHPTKLIAEEGPIEPFLNFINYLFGGDSDFLLTWMAMLAQNKRPRYMCILYSKENQVGKSSILGEILRQICGPHNTCQINKRTLESGFNGYLKGKQLVIIEELFASYRKLEIYNNFKEMITDKYIMINEKRVKLANIENFAAFLAFTNYSDALYLQEDDPRVLVLGCEKKPLDKELYKKLFYTIFEKPFPAMINHIYHYLKNMDIEEEIFRDAPNTSFKSKMVSHSRSLEEEIWEDIILENNPLTYANYFICPLIVVKNIEKAFDIKLSMRKLKVLIEKHNYRKERIQIERIRYIVYISPLLFNKDYKTFVKTHWGEANSQNVYFNMRPTL